MTKETRSLEELERVAEEQAALRRVATLIAKGATEAELAEAVTREIGHLFAAQRANTIRWDGDTIRVIGAWRADGRESEVLGKVLTYGGDTITARVVESGEPARVDSVEDLQTEFAKERWAERGLQATIGAPIVVDGKVWGIVIASRTRPNDPFPPDAEHHLGDFAALIAQSIVNAEARRETAQLVAEQSSLRRIATLVAAGRPQAEVLDVVTAEVGALFAANAVNLVRWNGVLDEVVVIASWSARGEPRVKPGSLEHPPPGGATLSVLETGYATRCEEPAQDEATCSAISAPVIVAAELHAALTATRGANDEFPQGAEIRLRSFADLAAQSITNERAQAELRASRARIVRAADEARESFERNLHDGAQQRLVSLSVVLRLAIAKLEAQHEAHGLLTGASEELTHALEELRGLARGLHPAILTKHGLVPAIEALANRAPVPVAVVNEIDVRLPRPIEAAVYYVVSESLTNVAKYAEASRVSVRATCVGEVVRIEVEDDGIGGANVARGSGLRGLADRVEALGGRLALDSPPGEGTRVHAELPIAQAPAAT